MRLKWAIAGMVASSAAFAQLPFSRPKTASSDSAGFSSQPGQPATINFRGAVPRGEATPEVLNLSLKDAIQMGLERNLGTLLTSTGERAARADRMIALARLLPQVHATVNESSEQINIAAFGFQPSSGIPGVIGPFKVFDSRAYVSQTLFNLRQLYEKRASERRVQAAELDSKDARETVIEIVTALYWQAVTGASQVAATEAEVATAQASYDLAQDRRTAGLAPAIDALRAQVELQAEQNQLIARRVGFEKQKLSLEEAIGLPSNQAVKLTDEFVFDPIKAPEESAVEQAYLNRKDYQSQQARLDAARLQMKGMDRVRVPTLSLDGDYGILGRSPESSHGTYNVSLGLNIPIFAGHAEEGAMILAKTEVDRQQTLLDGLKSHIGFEIRAAILDLQAASEQVRVGKSSVDLATEQVTQARDRFQAGVTDTLEVVQAQQQLAAANDNYIASLYAYTFAKVTLARAMGVVGETNP